MYDRSSGDSISYVPSGASLDVLVTWPGFDAEDEHSGRRLTRAGLTLRLAPKVGHRTPGELRRLMTGVRAAIVSTDPFDADVLRASRGLRVIARVGVGTDSVDVDAATREGVAICTTPGVNATTTADHTIALMLAALRRVAEHDRALRAGSWPRGRAHEPAELSGLTVGLVGFGTIGRLVAQRLRGFDVRLLVADPDLAGPVDGFEPVDLDALVSESDVVSLHAPLSASTSGLLDARRIAAMRSTAILVNTARGGLVDEQALIEALEDRRIRAAALDVFSEEPPTSARLRALPNVVMTPHLGGVSERSAAEMCAQATEAVLAVLEGRVPDGLVNPGALTAGARS